MKVTFCVLLFTLGAVVKAQQDLQDYWQADYPNLDNYNDAFEDSNESTDIKPTDITQDIPKPAEEPAVPENNDDYQIEDNRSDLTDKVQAEENKEATKPEEAGVSQEAAVNQEAAVSQEAAIHQVLPLKETEQSNGDSKELGLDNDTWDKILAEDPLPVPEIVDNNENIFEQTKDILNKDQDYLDELVQMPVGDDNSSIDKIIEETKKLLADSDAFDADDYENSDEQGKSDEDVFSETNDNDTPAKIYADLNADLDKLFATLDKLKDDNSNEHDASDDEVANDIKDYEEKYGKPYKEDVALLWRNAENDAANPENSKHDDENADDYENVDDSNLSQIFAANANASNENAKNDEQELVEFDLNNTEKTNETAAAPFEKIDEVKEALDYADNYVDSDDSEPNADDDIDSVIKQIFADDVKEPQSYGNDALVDEKKPKEVNAEDMKIIEAEEETSQKSVMVEDLNSAELSDLMTQFVAAHQEDLDVNSESFAKHIKPIHITLSVDEPTVVTSPDFPQPYPTNNIIDWIFDGPGLGIELNITDFSVNGAIGDYLLIKPGGLDETGKDGLIFSHRLTSVRRYRFADVNRMFVRFEAKPGWQFQQGFSFSVKLIWPLPTFADDEPEAEAVANPPEETLTLNLAGLTLTRFNEIKDQFQELLADMAKQYIKDNNIDLGLNTTLEVTQITRTAVCNIQWPEYENCVELTFGVPLHYEEDPDEPRLSTQDLDDMWTSYIIKDEFSERLRSLGITEYAIPNDRTVLMVWLVIAAGVLISMAMLAFALWRFSCFEDYTRMQSYGDTDSIQNEKRNLDLYPTPHQTLPPLYSENDYKWADDKYDDSTRVDMGGFANRSYIRDELYDLDSDEDVITPRDRKGAISPRDF